MSYCGFILQWQSVACSIGMLGVGLQNRRSIRKKLVGVCQCHYIKSLCLVTPIPVFF